MSLSMLLKYECVSISFILTSLELSSDSDVYTWVYAQTYLYFVMIGQEEKKEIQNENRCYLRFHNAISRAIQLNKLIFGDKLSKDNKEPAFQHSLRVAGCCQQILDQTVDQYHMGWLLGILHDNKEKDPVLFSQKIDWVLQDLKPSEQKKMKEYIDQLTSNKTLSKGEQKRQQLIRIEKMEMIPSWILIFDKMDNCRRFKNNPCGKSKEELDGYFAVAYLIFVKARQRHPQIKKDMIQDTVKFFEQMGKELGGVEGAKQKAKQYFKMFE